jgi:catechol 2,3-dioxygenase-like lactoylglutathione lyase family enzyme
MTTHDQSRFAIDRTNTVLYCQRWTETVAFYRSVLGLSVAFDNDWFVEFELTSSSFLSIADSSRATVAAVQGQGVTLTWQVPDLHRARDLLQASGVDVTEIRRRWGANVCYCHDPEGHRIELWSEAT